MIPLILPGALFLISLYLRLAFISKGVYYPDCLTLVDASRQIVDAGNFVPYLTGNNLPVILGAGFIRLCRLFGQNDPVFAINLMSVVFSAFAVSALYFFCKTILDEWTALFASLSLMVLPLFLSLSTYGNSQAPALFFVLMGFSYLAEFKDHRIGTCLTSALFFGLAGACRPQDILFLAIAISSLFLVAVEDRSSGGRSLSVWDKVLLFVCFWVTVIFCILLVAIPFQFQVAAAPAAGFLVQLASLCGLYAHHMAKLCDHFAFSSLTLWWVLGPMALVVFAGGFLLVRSFVGVFVVLMLWCIIPWVIYSCIIPNTMYVQRYYLISLVPLMVMQGYALKAISQKCGKIVSVIVVSCFVVLLLVQFDRSLKVLAFRHSRAVSEDFGRWIGQKTEEDALIICRDENIFITTYGKRAIMLLPSAQGTVWGHHYQRWLAEKMTSHRQLYVVVPPPYAMLDEDIGFIDYLKRNYRLEVVGTEYFEFWANSLMELCIIPERLYRISPVSGG